MSPSLAGKRFRRLALLVVLAWTGLVTFAYFRPTGTLLHRIELRTLDWRFHLRGPQKPASDIAIVAIDEESIRQIGRWPWPRERHAQLVRKLAAAGAKRIVFDIFFMEPDRSAGGGQSDDALVRATRETGIVYHAGYSYEPQANRAPALPPEIAGRSWREAQVRHAGGFSRVATLIEPLAIALPWPPVALAARGFGVANVLDSGDGVYRHLLPIARYGDTFYPSVVLAVSADLLGVTPKQIEIVPGRHIALGSKARLPLDMDGRMLINFAGGTGTYPYTSAGDVLSGAKTVSADAFRNKIVFIGSIAPGINDLRASPYETIYNGVETQANALANVLHGTSPEPVSPLVTAALLVVIGLFFGIFMPRTSTTGLFAWGGLSLAVYPWLCAHLFSTRGLVLDMVAPTLQILGSFLLVLILRLTLEERRRHQAYRALATFVPPQLADRIVDDEALTTMRGERRDITVFFADLRSFTATAEKMAPEDTVTFLNRYFQLMHEIIWEHEGTLDKYMGDEIMTFFNAPVSQEDHIRRAVRTAIEMQRRIKANQDEWTFLGVPELRAGIGIATGQALVGYVGSGERMQYTVIGSTVNLASRLQGQCKPLGCRILISDEVYHAVEDLIVAEDMGFRPIAGVTEPVRIWHVLDYRAPALKGRWEPVDEPSEHAVRG